MKAPLPKGAAVALILIVAGCDEGYSNDDGVKGASVPEVKEAITVRASPGEQPRAAFLVVPQRDFSPSDLAAAVRSAGYPCERVRRFNELEQSGKRTSIYKIDCLEYSYQYTSAGGQARIKRWTGNISGG
jgi:hypothetical protein